jgi:hypothetical protein
VDFKLELVLIPVSDVDRAKGVYIEKAVETWQCANQPTRFAGPPLSVE